MAPYDDMVTRINDIFTNNINENNALENRN